VAPIINLLIGVAMGFFYVNLVRGFDKSPTDFPEAGGLLFSTVMIVLVNAVLLIAVLSLVTAEYALISDYLRAVWSRSREHYRWVIQELRMLSTFL
jgi:hypothetical protein